VIAAIIKFVLSNFSLSLFVIGLLCALLAIFKHRKTANKSIIFEALLSFYCLFSVGVYYVYNFVMHVFFSKMVASFIGWQTSPFQKEIGFASLGFGVVGILAFRKDFGLRLAAVTGPAFFLWGAAGGHIYQIIAHHNFSPGNAGIVLWTDLLLPVAGFVLLIGWRQTTKPQASPGNS